MEWKREKNGDKSNDREGSKAEVNVRECRRDETSV